MSQDGRLLGLSPLLTHENFVVFDLDSLKTIAVIDLVGGGGTIIIA